MGSSRELETSNQKTTSPQDVIEYLDELFAYALSIGMTYKQYWYGDPKILNTYVRAEAFRQKRRNNELWLQGLYVHIAIGDLVPILNPFSKDHHAKKYLSKPIPITKEEQEEQERDKYERFVEYMKSLTKKK